MSNSRFDNSFEDDLINEFGDKDEDESLSELENELRPKEENLGMQAPEEEYVFEEEKTKKRKRKKKKKIVITDKTTKVLFIIGFIIILTCIIMDTVLIGYKIIHKEAIDIKPLLVYSDKPVIYDNNYMNKKRDDHIPIININNSSINDINNEIIGVYNDYYKNNPDYFRYDYALNDDILSIVLIYRNKLELEENYTYKFKTFNINLKTFSLYDNDLLLLKYKLKLSDVQKRMRSDLKQTYEDLLKKNYIDESYSYDRLIMDLDLSNSTSEINYYVEDNKLYLYRRINIYNNDKITSYFNEYSYKFYIK